MNGYHMNIASSSSTPYPDLLLTSTQSQQNQSQSMPSSTDNTQWTQFAYTNPPSHTNSLPASQSQPFNSPGWPNISQMQGMAAMGGLGLPLFSQQMFQEAIALSVPVGQADEKLLLQALIDSFNKKETYKDALNALHGKNGHSASMWKDYYLDHKDRLDNALSAYRNPLKATYQTIKKPSPSAFKQPSSPARTSSKRQTTPRRSTSLDRPVHRPQPLPAKRNTINSLTAPTPVFDNRLPPPNKEIQIPDPPSRSPTPPAFVVPGTRGNRYTPQDRQFFLKFIAWRLKRNPNMTRNELCGLLAEKAPHHTAQSWASHWSNNHDVPDKILAAAKKEKQDSESGDNEVKPVLRRRPNYHESSSEDDDEEQQDEMSDNDRSEAEGEVDLEHDEEPVIVYSENAMGVKGGPYTDADFYFVARHIASLPNFDEATGRERWDAFGERYTQRNSKAWAQFYRSNESALLRLARKIKIQGFEKTAAPSSIRTQYARPSWAQNSKRKRDVGHNASDAASDEDSSLNKRGREER